MKTPKKYIDNLKNKIIDKEMLINCLYSSNKRAKNCRDKIREYKNNGYYYDKYNYIEKYEKQKEEYYKQKEIMLSILKPKCIHKEFIRYEKRRIYDYEKDYKKYKNQYVWENCYFDYKKGYEVWFGDIELKDEPIYFYYLFYEIESGKYTFHTPIEEEDVSKYDLQVIEISNLLTEGNDINELISNQFVKKVIELIKKKDFTLQLKEDKKMI